MLNDFEKIWDSIEDFEFKPPKDVPDWCVYAQKFSEWIETSLKLSEDVTIMDINQAKLMLQERYHDWRSFVPKRHRDILGKRGHLCIYQVYLLAFERLKAMELSLSSPYPLIEMPPQLGGIFLGDLDQGE